jgi:hypothetical protein
MLLFLCLAPARSGAVFVFSALPNLLYFYRFSLFSGELGKNNLLARFMKKIISLLGFAVGSLLLLAALAPVLAVSPNLSLTPRVIRFNGTSQSTNWSGYAVTGSTGSVTSVSGSWIVPTATGSGRTTAYSSFWVGIDGYSSSTVEQTGTDSDVQRGRAVYYAWYEFYPNPMYQISMTVKPGDAMTASVTYSGGLFTASITDKTTGATFSTSATVSGAARSSAEWIAEAPSSYRGVLPLANFGTVQFGYDYTAISGTCYATIGGTSGAIGSFGSSVQQITMVTSGGTVKALPSALTSDGTSFTVTWKHS